MKCYRANFVCYFAAKVIAKLFVFDIDGTLLPNTTACLEIAKQTDTLSELKGLERQFLAGELDTKMFADSIYRMWGVLNEKVVRAAFEGATKLERINTVISMLSDKGHKSCVITMFPAKIYKLLRRWLCIQRVRVEQLLPNKRRGAGEICRRKVHLSNRRVKAYAKG